jgi:hypothetical protein
MNPNIYPPSSKSLVEQGLVERSLIIQAIQVSGNIQFGQRQYEVGA